jgi:hypothetical protein
MAGISRRAWWAIIAATLAGGMGGCTYLALRDEPPPADADLRPARRVVADEANGFLVLGKGQDPQPEEEDDDAGDETAEQDTRDSVHVEDETIRPTAAAFDRDLALRVLAKYADLLQKVEDGLSRPDFQVPEMRHVSQPIPYVWTWRRAASVVLCRSRLRHEEGREIEALNDAMLAVRFGRRIEDAQGGLIHYHIGLGIREQGLRQLVYLISRTRVGPQEMKRLVEEGARLLPTLEALQEVCQQEYALVSAAFGDQAEMKRELGSGFRGWWNRLAFKPNQARRLLAEDIQALMADAGKPEAARDRDLASKYSGRVGVLPSDGRLLLGAVVSQFARTLERRDLASLELSAARVLLALKCHVAERGRLPDTLAELVPAYLDAVPLDPFDGKPLRYSRAKKVIYSVGADLADAGGSVDPDPEQESNPAVKVKRKVVTKKREEHLEPTFRIEFE